MHISNNFKELQQQTALLVVSGERVAKLYLIQNAELQERDSVVVENPQYTDRGGIAQRQGGGELVGEGSQYERKDAYVEKNFIKELVKHVVSLSKQYSFDAIYWFAPSSLVIQEKKELPKEVVERIAAEFHGNYTKIHPQELLDKIRKYNAQRDLARAERAYDRESRTILEHTDHAALFGNRSLS